MPQLASSPTNLPEDLLAVFVGHEAESDSTLYPQGLNHSLVPALPTAISRGVHNSETSSKSTQGQKNPKSTSVNIHKD